MARHHMRGGFTTVVAVKSQRNACVNLNRRLERASMRVHDQGFADFRKRCAGQCRNLDRQFSRHAGTASKRAGEVFTVHVTMPRESRSTSLAGPKWYALHNSSNLASCRQALSVG